MIHESIRTDQEITPEMAMMISKIAESTPISIEFQSTAALELEQFKAQLAAFQQKQLEGK